MNLLLDTHTFLWFAVASLGNQLSQATRELLEDPLNVLHLSPVSIWETAIKVSIGKLQLPQSVRQIAETQLRNNSLRLLAIQLAHLELIETLPFHHKDPFDRLLIAQAKVEGFTLVSRDPAFDSYGVDRLWLT